MENARNTQDILTFSRVRILVEWNKENNNELNEILAVQIREIRKIHRSMVPFILFVKQNFLFLILLHVH